MSKTLVHVNTHRLRAGDANCVAVRRGRSGRAIYTEQAVIRDRHGDVVAVVQRHENPLKCGARVWVEVRESGSVTLGDG